jgi:FHS family L-fucose permease-like MFS transporter
LSIKLFIPFCKAKFGLDQFQSQLIDFAFMVRIMLELYFFIFSSIAKKRHSKRMGIQKELFMDC